MIRERLRRLLVRDFVTDAIADPRVRRALADEFAGELRARMVCCHAFEKGDGNPSRSELMGHSQCYWGEDAARLIEGLGHGTWVQA